MYPTALAYFYIVYCKSIIISLMFGYYCKHNIISYGKYVNDFTFLIIDMTLFDVRTINLVCF